MWHHGTARLACPAALVDTFAHRAAPDAHGGFRSVRFRTSFPTRRPGRRCSVPGGRGAAVRKPLPRRPDAGRGAPSSSGASLTFIKVACTSPIVGRLVGSADSIASTTSAS